MSASVDIAKESIAGWAAGSGSVGTTPQALGDFPVTKKVVVRANGANSGVITVGPSSAQASEGFILGKGEQSPEIYVDDINKVWVVGSDVGQGYSWIAS